MDVFQLTELKIKLGTILSQQELAQLDQQSEFGKLYTLALNYCMLRPHSEKEIRDYLWKKTLPRKLRNKKTGELYEKKGVSLESVSQTIIRLKEKRYVDDEKFTRFWVENRNRHQGSSLRKLRSELTQKGVALDIQNKILSETTRNDAEELQKIIAKKSKRYNDPQKLMRYLVSQGFSYNDVKKSLQSSETTTTTCLD
ncbi:MAG: regulatory protein RecX [Candidatus Saccharibacteria bacterium]|nr:regulatory protein RecX [Candidatus Saccharibacteria bacterium]